MLFDVSIIYPASEEMASWSKDWIHFGSPTGRDVAVAGERSHVSIPASMEEDSSGEEDPWKI